MGKVKATKDMNFEVK